MGPMMDHEHQPRFKTMFQDSSPSDPVVVSPCGPLQEGTSGEYSESIHSITSEQLREA